MSPNNNAPKLPYFIVFLIDIVVCFLIIIGVEWLEYKTIYPIIPEDYSEWFILLAIITFGLIVWINGKFMDATYSRYKEK